MVIEISPPITAEGDSDGRGRWTDGEDRGREERVRSGAPSTSGASSYFTSNARLLQWLTAVADVEARIDGKYELFWQPDDRENNSTIGCRVTAMAPGQLLAFQWRSPRQFKPFANTADPLTHVVITVVPEKSGARIHLVHSGWHSSPAWEEARTWQEKAWVGAFNELERVAKAE